MVNKKLPVVAYEYFIGCKDTSYLSFLQIFYTKKKQFLHMFSIIVCVANHYKNKKTLFYPIFDIILSIIAV